MRWYVVGLLCAGMVIGYIDRVNLSSAMPLMEEDFGWSKTMQGQALAAFFWIYAALQIPAGLAADRWGMRITFLGGFLIWCTATAATGLTSTLGMLIGFRLLLGLGQAILTPGGMRYIRMHFSEEQRGSAIGIFMAGTKFGPAIGFIVVAYLIESFGWRGMFLALGLGALVWLIPFMAWVRKDDPAALPGELGGTGDEKGVSTAQLVKSPVIWGTFIGTFCYMYFVYYCMTWMPTYFKEQYGMSIKEQGWYGAVAFGGMAVVIISAGWVGDRLVAAGRDPVAVRKGFTIAGLCCASTQTLAAYTDSVSVMLFFAIFSLCGLGLMTANYWALTQTLIPGGRIALVVGIQNTASNLAGAISPWVTGWLVERTGSFDAPIRSIGVWLVIGLASYIFLVRRKYAPVPE